MNPLGNKPQAPISAHTAKGLPLPAPVPTASPAILEPLARVAADVQTGQVEDGMALSLSGGGYRAMLFHLGALWRMSELGLLPKLKRISSVSGGSIVSAKLALAWPKLGFNSSGVATRFVEEVVSPIRKLAGSTIDVWAVLFGWLGFSTIFFYRKFLYGHATLQDLPEQPRFVVNASNVQSGVLWRFSRPYMRDYRVGQVLRPKTPLAVAVAASSAFPPVLSPVVLSLRSDEFVPGSGDDLQREPYTTRIVLTDGGVYDNLGLETTWKRYRTVLVSEASQRPLPEEHPSVNWVSHMLRVIPLIHNQVASLRKRQLIASYLAADPEFHRNGAYWGIGADIRDYPAPGCLPCPPEETLRLAATPTRLQRMDTVLQERLINWGYAMCDAAIRSYVDAKLTPPAAFPYPRAGVGKTDKPLDAVRRSQ